MLPTNVIWECESSAARSLEFVRTAESLDLLCEISQLLNVDIQFKFLVPLRITIFVSEQVGCTPKGGCLNFQVGRMLWRQVLHFEDI